MNSQEIERLYENQEFEAALEAANASLIQEPANKDLLFTKVRCLFELSMRTDSEKQSIQQARDSYDTCSELLSLDPSHVGALSYRAYIGVYNNFVFGKDEQVLSDCTRLVEQSDDASKARFLEWRSQAYLRQHKPTAALEDMQAIIASATVAFSNDQPQRNVAQSRAHFSMGEIQEQHLQDIPAALEQYRLAFEKGTYLFSWLPIARLALDHGQYDFAAQLLAILPTTLTEVTDEFVALMEKVKQLYHEHPSELKLAVMYCTSTATFPEITMPSDDETDLTLQQLSLGKKLMQQFPEEEYFYIYLGRTLFLAGQYADAIPYFEKGIAINPFPMSLARWAYAVYKVKGAFPDNLPESKYDIPYEWYDAGVSFGEWEVDDEADMQHERILNQLYYNAIKRYKAYWLENSGNAKAHHEHHFAMCCNNYGISLSKLGRHEEAIEIHNIGYRMSPFWEQLNSRAYAYRDTEQYDLAAVDWTEVLNYSHMMDPVHHASTYNLLIDVLMSNLNDRERAIYWYDKFIETYESSLAQEIAELEDDDQAAAQHQVNQIITTRALIQGEPGDLPNRIATLEKHLEQFPDDSDAYFNLMQMYFENNQYEQCIGSATSRLSLGELDRIPIASRAKIYYFRGKAYLLLHNYERAIQDMTEVLNYISQDPDTSDVDYFNVYGYIAEAALALNDNQTALTYSRKSIAISDENNWKWDEITANIAFTEAAALKNTGEQKEAVRKLKHLLEKMPSHEQAAQKLKEWKPKWGWF
ncbi:MAG TPA: tetratricopeptide repeat protein [Chitinophaga sp.]|uniref:tetratricopeptide repeat protein n=1 Tax=Chitinophaga sp. TaxID=1869181 RepID=UPI002C201D68|nr:tetratricopeptide repeat protein [Chitinophaga sp.]HVI45308.1 tetratricopeptide repeat protein [Chitinophaga sp.]